MAYQFWDGFDDYTSGSTQLWDTLNSGANPQYSSNFARFAAVPGLISQGVRFTTGWLSKNLLGNINGPIVSMAFQFENLPNATSQSFVSFLDSATHQVQLAVGPSGALEVWRGVLGVKVASTAPATIQAGVWYFIDFAPTIGSANGTVLLRLGNVVLLNLAGLNTQVDGNAFINQVGIGFLNGGSGVTAIRFDDFHGHDNTGSAPNAVLGDSRIFTKMPSGQGYSTLWTPTGAGTNWQCVDDATPDGDATYVSSATPGQIDGYALPKAGFVVAPNGLVRRSYVRKDDVSVHTFQNGIRSGNSNALGTAFAVPSAYAWTDGATCYVNDPATGLPFTAAAADAVQNIISMTS